MFTMILLHSLVLLSVINVSCQELPTTPEVQPLQPCSPEFITNEDLRVQIAQQNTRFAQYYTRLEEQNKIIEQQNTKFAVQDVEISDQNTKFAVQDVKISDQNTKLSEQKITILEQNIKIKNLEMKIEQLEKVEGRENQPSSRNNSTSKETGSIFTRWGRRDCPGNVSQLVYSGITGGSWYDHSGAAAEYVCLPPDPTWNVNKYFGGEWGYMYGAEYQGIPKPRVNFKVPCAVCRTSQFSTVLMIPARSECYQGWQKAYHGEIVSGRHDQKAASQYACLDRDPQTDGDNSNDNGKLMFPVKAACGSLPCPPYHDNTVLTCVVCLK